MVKKYPGRFGADTYISKPNFKCCTIFTPNLVEIEMEKIEVCMSKPIYAGFTILDLSNICFFEFHYDYMKEKLGDMCQLQYCDTDSLIYLIKEINIYVIIKQDIKLQI